jgi:hypothetical protein
MLGFVPIGMPLAQPTTVTMTPNNKAAKGYSGLPFPFTEQMGPCMCARAHRERARGCRYLYSPSCREEIFSQTIPFMQQDEFPANSILGNSGHKKSRVC